MANPQKENGYTPIANEILEKLVQAPMLVSELKIVLLVIRKTYGFHKKEDAISLSQFQEGTGFSRNTVIKGLDALVQARILVKAPLLVRQGNVWKLNKNWEEWLLVQAHRLVQFGVLTSAVGGGKLVQAPEHTKDKTKENKRKIKNLNKLRDDLIQRKIINSQL